ncbi:MAG: L,D-transpeptidase family protein [Phycisphaerae bacterium]
MRKRTKSRLILLLGVIAIAAAVAWPYLNQQPGQTDTDGPATASSNDMDQPGNGTDGTRPTLVNVENVQENDSDNSPAPVPDPHPDKTGPIDPLNSLELLRPQVKMSAEQADRIYDESVRLLSGSEISDAALLAVRTNLSAAYFSHQLATSQQEHARKLLTAMADKTILSPVSYDNDPYTFYYTFQPGDILTRVVDKNHLALRVPDQLILRVNPRMDPQTIRPGTRIKMVKGPFHAVVYKDKFVMDVYLKNYDGPITFIRRLDIGIGADDATPSGAFQVTLGKKLKHAAWNPPPGSQFKKTIAWGQPDYPLGKDGLWISLSGVEEANRHATGYGLHGTDKPDSVGKAESLGCIRMRDADIEFTFAVLYEKWSTVHLKD